LRFEVHEVLLGKFDAGGCIPELADAREEGGAVDPGVGGPNRSYLKSLPDFPLFK
jgi:hypothetical protein